MARLTGANVAFQVLGALEVAPAMGACAYVSSAICGAPTLAWRHLRVLALHGACSWVGCSISWSVGEGRHGGN